MKFRQLNDSLFSEIECFVENVRNIADPQPNTRLRLIRIGAETYLALPVAGTLEKARLAVQDFQSTPYPLLVTAGDRGTYICARWNDLIAESIHIGAESDIS